MATDVSKSEHFPPIRACLFDMDGLLINSEDLYTEVTNTILAEVGRDPLDWSLKSKLQGRPGAVSMGILSASRNLPITPDQFTTRYVELQRELFPKSKPLPGVTQLLRTLLGAGIEIAVATSSNSASYQLKSERLGQEIFDYFPPEQIVKGDDTRISAGQGKPSPVIYETALETINERRRKEGKDKITALECLVFEDAVLGVEAGRRAGMRVVWVPHQGLLEVYKGREEEVLAGLCEEHAADTGNKIRGEVGQLRDGWGELRDSLVGFDYSKYGIQVAGEIALPN